MDKIKVWDKESKQIFEVAKINFETKEVSYIGSPSGYDVDALFEQVIFLKPVGVKDILGKDIYQWDIVQGDRIGVVEYLDYYFDFGQYGCVPDVEGGLDPSNLKVIGNIFQNQNLLYESQIYRLKRDGIL